MVVILNITNLFSTSSNPNSDKLPQMPFALLMTSITLSLAHILAFPHMLTARHCHFPNAHSYRVLVQSTHGPWRQRNLGLSPPFGGILNWGMLSTCFDCLVFKMRM